GIASSARRSCSVSAISCLKAVPVKDCSSSEKPLPCQSGSSSRISASTSRGSIAGPAAKLQGASRSEKVQAMTAGRHQEQQGKGEDGVAARGEKGDPRAAHALLQRRRNEAEQLFLVWPEHQPEVEQHRRTDPGTEADGRQRALQQQRIDQP